MSVPLGHKNHRNVCASKAISITSVFGDTNKYRIVDGHTVLSKDGKTLVYLDQNLTGPYVVPSGVEIIAPKSLGKPKVSSITLPKSVNVIAAGATKSRVWFHAKYDVIKSKNAIIGDAYTIFPRVLIFKDKSLLAEVQESVKRKRLPCPIKSIIRDIESVSLSRIVPALYDKHGVKYSDGGETLEGESYNTNTPLTTYRIPDGVKETTSWLPFKTVEHLIIPASLKEITDMSEVLKTITFLGTDTICTFFNCEGLTRISIPAGSREHYEKQFPQHIDKIIEE